ncbi:hypothetical protein HRJ34_20005 [Rhizorhabdus wittichii]|uniref:Class I SAM-dependent methyltransferase n=1 Tax=Rhizorhabdus wittichii TaxID=160791 RepID=A0A975D0J3_9SPHN|nr:class I SAM-dependent methyltransferase [Rhizorhabdus wittichii]QTH20601.1 hypothetical protein HRJ34_20005 [Rhizorhabdus wittichii]
MKQKFPQLFEIANRVGTDKGHKGPSKKWSSNNYTDIYQAYFGERCDEALNLCEIGLGVPGKNWESDIAHGDNRSGGGSMRMWYEFFPNAAFYGLDINPADHLENDRIKTFVVDQSSVESLNGFKKQIGKTMFDIIIDDGSHIADHQQLTLSLLWERLKPGGYYVIEDLNDLRSGETRHTKHAPQNCESTRIWFQNYQQSGAINPNNNFANFDFLDEITYLAFHSFPVMQQTRDHIRELVRMAIGRGGKGLLRHEFRSMAPKIVLFRKAG